MINKKQNKKCCSCCRGPDMNVERLVGLDGFTDPKNNISNAVNNQKYNFFNFLPLVLFNQFKLFFNFFQLAINLSQFVPILKVGIFSYIQAFSSAISHLQLWSCFSHQVKKLMMTSKDISEINNPIPQPIGITNLLTQMY